MNFHSVTSVRFLFNRLVTIASVAITLAFASSASAVFHTYRIEQIYSNADGTVQFIVMHESQSSDGENLWGGHVLTAHGGGVVNSFTFPNDLPSSATSGTRVLIATEGFAALGVITPDYVVPDHFLSTTSGSVNFADVDQLGYSSLPTDGVMALDRNEQPVMNLATNFAGQSVSISAPGPGAVANYEGLWWNSPAGSESGWGINLAHQGDVIFATWFTYDTTGKAWWLSMSAAKTAEATYGGTLYQTTGPAFNAVPFNPSSVTATAVGNATLTFSSTDDGTFAYTVNGVSQIKSITRQVFGTVPACTFGAQPDLTQATNYQDLWWNVPAGSESGWGIDFTHQGDTIFATWFTYGLDGTPMWLSVTASKTAAQTYSGTFYRTTGPAFNAVPFSPSAITATAVGNATLTFTHGNAGTFAYTVDGVAQTKTITRQVFRTPGTVCR